MIAEIYAFLNRNLLKPLNVQIDEMRDYLAEYILENSAEVYLDAGISYSWRKNTGNVNIDIPEQIVFNATGNATLAYAFYCTSGGSEATTAAILKIYKNGNLLTQVNFSTSTTARTLSLSNIAKGDVISFHVTTNLYYTATTAYFNAVNVLATPIYARTLDLIEVTGV